MVRFIFEKLLRGILVLVGTMLIMFLMMHAIPGNPWANYSEARRPQLNIFIDDTSLNVLNRRFGLDLPLWRQFTRYLIGDIEKDGSFTCGAICGNLGPSIIRRGFNVEEVIFGAPVGQTFWQSRFGYSMRLAIYGFIFAITVGIPLGILSAVNPNSRFSRTTSVVLAAFISIPNFVLGLLAIIILASWLHIMNVLPYWNNPSDWIVPVIVLSIMPMASLARVTRTAMINVKNEDYVRTARGKGLPETKVQLVHIMRNALVPIVTFLGPTLMEMFASLFIVENLYGFPGIGNEYWQSILKLDYPMILGLTLIYGVGIVLVNILNQVICERLDPRIREIRESEAA